MPTKVLAEMTVHKTKNRLVEIADATITKQTNATPSHMSMTTVKLGRIIIVSKTTGPIMETQTSSDPIKAQTIMDIQTIARTDEPRIPITTIKKTEADLKTMPETVTIDRLMVTTIIGKETTVGTTVKIVVSKTDTTIVTSRIHNINTTDSNGND